MKPAVFLDRDGTLIEDRGHLASPSQVVFFPRTFEALRRLAPRFALFIVTNQPGIAEGAVTADEVACVNEHVRSALADAGIPLADVFVCPHRRSDGCPCIKPHPYYLYRAAEAHRLDLRRSFVIGDHPHDVELALRAGARGVYVLTGHGSRHRHELPHGATVTPDIAAAADAVLSGLPLGDAPPVTEPVRP